MTSENQSVETEATDMGTRIREAFDGIDMGKAIRLLFGNCPKCGERMVRGSWLRFCADRGCQGYIGVLNADLGRRIEAVTPQTQEERDQIDRLRQTFEITGSLRV